MKRILALFIGLALTAGCSTISTLAVTPSTYDARVMILKGNAEGAASRFWFLGLGGMTDGVFEATKKAEQSMGADLLLNPSVDVQTTHYLFGLITVENVAVRGLAVKFIPSYKTYWNGATPAAANTYTPPPASAPAPTPAPTPVPTLAPSGPPSGPPASPPPASGPGAAPSAPSSPSSPGDPPPLPGLP